MLGLEIRLFPCLSDNYGVLIHDGAAGVTASIDAPEAAAVEEALEEAGWTLTHILVTHHHADHTQGIPALKARYGCKVVGPRAEADKVPGIDESLGEGDTFQFGRYEARIFDTPGHTLGHIAWWFPDAGIVFAGDTLFALGCGRVFEGTMEQMWGSLEKLARLPRETLLYCGHEYTQANARFAVTIEPDNVHLQARVGEIDEKRARGEPTIPSTIGAELASNPFLRADRDEVKMAVGMPNADPAAVFAEIRRRKDNF
ncbi:hydroxyacylglutathione hydrolase [Microbaculum marinisediminis]|uniref:Hydroxyacylglutathione hydrolase n=1 Tax=Microbaculum marinisediminis TaxID=2931392 RepID=A0AAW5R168_9HYPH|nr:hydroxyacylglutathione hydrolase [Microbaculum sp. A6E488]MCT8972451.1 hydroxyacylglutathione hydrolase [Microbaculum sp. A6E488]